MICWYRKGESLLNEIQATTLSTDEVAIWFLGQCGFVIKFQDTVFMIDPVLNDIKDEGGNTKRLYAPPFEPEKIQCKYIFCTHKHADHMAKETILSTLVKNNKAKVIVPEACQKSLLEWGINREKIFAVDEKEEYRVGNFSFFTVSTAHPTHQRDKEGKIRNLAYYIKFGEIRLLHLGDTYLTEQLLTELRKLPGVDILMVPINGRDFYREQQNIVGNMEPEEAAKLAIDINADLTIPMHYDMMKGNTSDPLRFVKAYLDMIHGGQKWMLPALGERMIYKASTE